MLNCPARHLAGSNVEIIFCMLSSFPVTSLIMVSLHLLTFCASANQRGAGAWPKSNSHSPKSQCSLSLSLSLSLYIYIYIYMRNTKDTPNFDTKYAILKSTSTKLSILTDSMVAHKLCHSTLLAGLELEN